MKTMFEIGLESSKLRTSKKDPHLIKYALMPTTVHCGSLRNLEQYL